MYKFKKGDIVTLIKLHGDDEEGYVVGDTLEILENSDVPYCRKENGSKKWAFDENNLKLKDNIMNRRDAVNAMLDGKQVRPPNGSGYMSFEDGGFIYTYDGKDSPVVRALTPDDGYTLKVDTIKVNGKNYLLADIEALVAVKE